MSRGNAQLLRQAASLWNAGEVGPGLDSLDPDVEIHTPFSSIAGEPYRGIDGYRRWRSDILDQFELWEMHIDEIRELEEDRLFVLGHVRVRGRGSGVALEQSAATVVDFRAGHLLRLQIFLSEDEAMRAAGVRA